MNSKSIGVRLALSYSALLFTAVLLFAAVLWVTMRYSLRSDLDGELAGYAERLGQFLAREAKIDPANMAEELEEYSLAFPADHLVQVEGPDGKAMLDEGIASAKLRAGEANWRGSSGFSLRVWNGVRYRLYEKPYAIGGYTYRVFVAASLEPVARMLRRLAVIQLTCLPLLLLVSMWAGLWLSRRALTPVDRLTEAARSLSLQHLGERLPVPRTEDELQRLTVTWNLMLERLAASVTQMRRFTADASHELRTPIAFIRASSEIALRRSRPESEYVRVLTGIHLESERMTALVEDLLFLAREDAPAAHMGRQRVRLDEPVMGAVGEFRALAQDRQVSLRLENRSDGWVLGSAIGLRRLVGALLENAIKYTPPGGCVTIAMRNESGTVELSVRDTGPGISGEALPHIFERFFRAEPSRNRETGGYGLGLSIAQAIAFQHEAEIEVNTSSGGTEFRVRFACLGAPEGTARGDTEV